MEEEEQIMQLAVNIADDDNRGGSGGSVIIIGARAEGVYGDAIGLLVEHLGGDEDERIEDSDGENRRELRGWDVPRGPIEAPHQVVHPIHAEVPVFRPPYWDAQFWRWGWMRRWW